MSEPGGCPRLMDVHRLRESGLSAIRAAEVRRHLEHCALCRAEYENWDRLSVLLACGDPAPEPAPVPPRRLRDQLLEACASWSEPADAAAPGGNSPELREVRWWAPARVALALAPLAAAALLLLYAGRSGRWFLAAPPGPSRHGAVVRRPPPPAAGPYRGAPPSLPRIALTHEPPDQPEPGRAKPAPQAGRHLRRAIGRPRHIRSDILAAAPADAGRRRISRRLIASTRRRERLVLAPEIVPAAPPPIRRIVIQVDGRPPAPRLETASTTHVTIIAEGNVEAPGAKLTVVKSRREETLP